MKEKLTLILFVMFLGSILTAILLAVDWYTAPIIARNNEIKAKMSVLEAFEIPFTKDNVEQVFDQNITVINKPKNEFYRNPQGDIAFEFSGSGLWGPITGILAMYPDLKTIKGITIIHQEETPGLGSRIAEKQYLDNYKEKQFDPALSKAGKPGANANTGIDTISGATMSSVALIELINNQKQFLSDIKDGTE